MDNRVPDNIPLENYFPVPKAFYPFPIHFLRIASDQPYHKSLSRILNSLQDNQFNTVDVLLQTTIVELRSARNFGERGISILLELLQRITDHPELVQMTDELDHGRPTF